MAALQVALVETALVVKDERVAFYKFTVAIYVYIYIHTYIHTIPHTANTVAGFLVWGLQVFRIRGCRPQGCSCASRLGSFRK